MMFPQRLILALIFACLILTEPVRSHDEPPKTQAEKMEQARNRNMIKQRGVRVQQLWIVRQSDSTPIADSTLLLINRFDRSGNLVEQIVPGEDGDSRSVSLYDDQCRWLEELSYSKDSLEERTVFIYNSEGIIVRIVSYDNRGQVTGRLDYQYRDDALQIFVKKTGLQDSLQYTILYSLEPAGDFTRQIEAVQKNADGSLKMIAKNEFEGEQRARKSVFGSGGELLHSFSYTYTDSGQVKEILKYLPGDSLVSRQTYQYDTSGLLLAIVEYDAGGTSKKTLRYVYEFF